MTEEIIVSEEEPKEEETGEEAPPVKPSGNKSKFIIIGALLLVLGGGGSAFFFFTSTGQNLIGRGAKDKEEASDKSPELNIETVQYTKIPEILINLRAADGRSSFLKALFVVVSPNEEVAKKVEKIVPLLLDQYQVYLRELDVEDLKGSVGIQRIRQELVNRTNALIGSEKVINVLFTNFLIQ